MAAMASTTGTARGTRKEERLFKPDEYGMMTRLRCRFADMRPKEAMEELLALIARYPTNQDLIAEGAESLSKKKDNTAGRYHPVATLQQPVRGYLCDLDVHVLDFPTAP